jgi:hypothetical protein
MFVTWRIYSDFLKTRVLVPGKFIQTGSAFQEDRVFSPWNIYTAREAYQRIF